MDPKNIFPGNLDESNLEQKYGNISKNDPNIQWHIIDIFDTKIQKTLESIVRNGHHENKKNKFENIDVYKLEDKEGHFHMFLECGLYYDFDWHIDGSTDHFIIKYHNEIIFERSWRIVSINKISNAFLEQLKEINQQAEIEKLNQQAEIEKLKEIEKMIENVSKKWERRDFNNSKDERIIYKYLDTKNNMNFERERYSSTDGAFGESLILKHNNIVIFKRSWWKIIINKITQDLFDKIKEII